jgi:hypothetical protein
MMRNRNTERDWAKTVHFIIKGFILIGAAIMGISAWGFIVFLFTGEQSKPHSPDWRVPVQQRTPSLTGSVRVQQGTPSPTPVGHPLYLQR